MWCQSDLPEMAYEYEAYPCVFLFLLPPDMRDSPIFPCFTVNPDARTSFPCTTHPPPQPFLHVESSLPERCFFRSYFVDLLCFCGRIFFSSTFRNPLSHFSHDLERSEITFSSSKQWYLSVLITFLLLPLPLLFFQRPILFSFFVEKLPSPPPSQQLSWDFFLGLGASPNKWTSVSSDNYEFD